MIQMVTQRGRSGPVVFCDHCGERITDTGNYQWRMLTKESERPVDVFFTHKHCSNAWEVANPAPEAALWGSMEIECFPVYLANNLKLVWKKAKERARDFASW